MKTMILKKLNDGPAHRGFELDVESDELITMGADPKRIGLEEYVDEHLRDLTLALSKNRPGKRSSVQVVFLKGSDKLRFQILGHNDEVSGLEEAMDEHETKAKGKGFTFSKGPPVNIGQG